MWMSSPAGGAEGLDFARWELHQRATIEQYNAGITDLGAGELNSAEIAFQEVVRRESKAAVGWYGLAIVWLRQNKPEEAIPILEMVATQYPRGDVASQLSRAHFAQQNFQRASFWGDLAVEMSPLSVDAQSAAQWAWMRVGDYAKALEHLQQARELEASGNWDCLEIRLLIEQNDLQAAERLADGCAKADVKELSDSVLARLRKEGARDSADDAVSNEVRHAIELIQVGRYDAGIEALNSVLERFPTNPSARVIRGTAFYLKRDYVRAREDLSHALEAQTWVDLEADGLMHGILTRSSEEAFLVQIRQGIAVLALLYAETGDVSSAQGVIQKARAAEKEGIEIDAAAAALLWHGGQRQKAWDEFVTLYRRAPTSRFLIRVMSELAHADSDSVPLELREELIARGGWKQSYNLAAGQSNLGRFAACKESADKALVRFMDNAEARALFADLAYGCALGLNDFEAASQLLERHEAADFSVANRLRHAAKLVNERRGAEALVVMEGLQELPESARSIQVAARLDAGDLDGALEWANGGEDPQLTYELAYILYDKGRFGEAATLFERCCPVLNDEDCHLLRELARQSAGTE